MKLNRIVFSLATCAVVLVGCQKHSSEPALGENQVTAGDPTVARKVLADNHEFLVLGNEALTAKAKAGEILLADSARGNEVLSSIAGPAITLPLRSASPVEDAQAREGSLIVGYPLGLLKEAQVFGGVVTKVSDKTSETLGRLKLSDLTPVHVRLGVAKTGEGKFAVALMGCPSNCSESSAQVPIIGIPIVGVSEDKTQAMLDLAPIGEALNLVKMMDPTGSYTQLKTKSSKTTVFDFSSSTLVFDIETKMIPLTAKLDDETAAETSFTVRWYLRLTSAFNPAFVARPATEGVGFFMTRRTATPKIQRFTLPTGAATDDGPVKYYVKNVPTEFRAAFASSFDEWNDRFLAVTGKKLLSYEFIEPTDPRAALLVAGDIRFNIVEWDLDNQAPYGGLGPSIANQFTGEILSANVLIQGPAVVGLYSKWFKVSALASALHAEGRIMEADKLVRTTFLEFQAKHARATSEKYALKLGSLLDFEIHSQRPELEDPLFQRDDFDLVPAGTNYADYMFGYFHDMVAHELGHDLGLRHNFRGNLGAEATPAVGKVSHSIMEYLNRNFRHLDHIGEYDVMAVKYGYLGIEPERKDMFCTDENVADADNLTNSAECSREDATPDPFGYLEVRFAQTLSYIVARGSKEAPTWTPADMDRELKVAVVGMGLYATTAEATASTWTNFFTGGDRPHSGSEVKSFVLSRLKGQLCGDGVKAALDEKGTPEARAKTVANLEAYRTRIKEVLAPLKIAQGAELDCAL